MSEKYQISLLSQSNINEIVSILCDSFADYPVMRFVLEPGSDYYEKLQILIHFFVMARIYRVEPVLGISNKQKLQGVALVSDLTKSVDSPALNKLREQVWQKLGSDARSRYEQCGEVWSKFDVDEPHIHLNMIGVLQSAQGLGLGRQLVEHVQQLSQNDPDSKGVTLTTEDPAKVSFYEYLGYKIIGKTKIATALETWIFYRRNM